MSTLAINAPQKSEQSADLEFNLFDLAQQYFYLIKQEYAEYGIQVNPATRLHPTTGFLSYYDLQDKQIYLSLPDHISSATKLRQLLLRSLYGFGTNEELYTLARLLLPHTIAHELAHALRHDCGLFSNNLWHEEQLANQLAIIAIRRYRSSAEQQQLLTLLEQVITHLSIKFGTPDTAVNTYRNFWQGLRINNQIENTLWEHLKLNQKLFNAESNEVLCQSNKLSHELVAKLQQRTAGINQINNQYAANQSQYMYYQFYWIYLDLKNSDNFYIEEFIQQHLNLAVGRLS
ncbi:hypothetical protein IQ276_034300 [Desmonostoc muscorum LEGE 12446]|uniref:Uncharacterized protein n=1 Tax=Desmonostoc muscorum LEGE 12446 TaxID=1828758 RepID=A0A8J6ZWD0_DESMC|nr:hypothetical protein [Desmonostoc muscorum]MCF2151400.1 hypothetical protein [Desmonostoc muscorum LEGE 12446]